MGLDEGDVLESKRHATIYQILVEVAERQPAVSQQEIAEAIGVTPQAISDYLQELVETGYVETGGRGRYEITNEGVDWLIGQTDRLREYIDHVSEGVLEDLEVDTVLAGAAIEEGQTVSLSMRDGTLLATPDGDGEATAVAMGDAEAGREVGVTNFEGVIDYDFGAVTVISIPPVSEGGSRVIDDEQLVTLAEAHDLVAVDGPGALAATRTVDLSPDVRFGTRSAVQEAATRGLDVLLLAQRSDLSGHTDELRERAIAHEVIDPLAGD